MNKNSIRYLYWVLNGKKIRINGRRVQLIDQLIPFFGLKQDNIIEPELSYFFRSILKPGDSFIDIGANVGVLTVEVSELVGEKGCVIAFEPNPLAFIYLTKMLDLNQSYSNVRAFPLAIGGTKGVLQLSINESASSLMERSSLIQTDEYAETTDVWVNTLDNLIPETVTPHIIKVDVEGAELDVLKGSFNTIQGSKPIVCIEVHALYFDNPKIFVKQIFDFFDQIEYQCFNLIKGTIETMDGFLYDTGVSGFDPVSKNPLSELGYGNLVFAPKINKQVEKYFKGNL